MSRVFVVQQPAVFTHGRFVPKYDLTPAKRFGELVFLLQPGNVPADRIGQAATQLRVKLKSFTVADYLLAVGDPVAIAAAVVIARDYAGTVNILKWDWNKGTYSAFPLSI